MARKTKSPETRIKELGLELQFAQADWIDDYRFWMKRGGGVIVVGYLVNDRDCDNPLENCDAMGKIITKHDDKYFYSLVGCNEYGQPDTDEFIDMIQRLNGGEPVIGEISAAEKMWEEARKQGKIGARYAQPLRERYNSGYELATLTDLN